MDAGFSTYEKDELGFKKVSCLYLWWQKIEGILCCFVMPRLFFYSEQGCSQSF